MKQFAYVITDPVGIHARPAGMLVKEAKQFSSKIMLQKGEKAADATRMMSVMGLGVKCGDTLSVSIEGADEDAAAGAMRTCKKTRRAGLGRPANCSQEEKNGKKNHFS